MLQTICYISSSSNDLTDKHLEELYYQVKGKNLDLNISGILIHDNKNFFQILEGNIDEVKKLYKKIVTDKRHNHIIKIIDSNITQRIFEDYLTGFEVIDSFEKKDQLNDYLNWLKKAEISSVDRVIKIVENFIGRSL